MRGTTGYTFEEITKGTPAEARPVSMRHAYSGVILMGALPFAIVAAATAD